MSFWSLIISVALWVIDHIINANKRTGALLLPLILFKQSDQRSDFGDVKLTIYNKNLTAKLYEENDGSFKFPKVENLVILVPGAIGNTTKAQEEYVKSFCETINNSYKKYNDYGLICYDWKPMGQHLNQDLDLAQQKGITLAKFIHKNYRNSVKKFHLVCHDLGCVVAQSAGRNAIIPIDFIFGLDQRNLTHPNSSSLYLSKDAADMVEAIYSDYNTFPEVHRNFYFVSKLRRKINIYEEYARIVENNGNRLMGSSCATLENYKEDNCKVPMWSEEFIENSIETLKMGNFFMTRE